MVQDKNNQGKGKKPALQQAKLADLLGRHVRNPKREERELKTRRYEEEIRSSPASKVPALVPKKTRNRKPPVPRGLGLAGRSFLYREFLIFPT